MKALSFQAHAQQQQAGRGTVLGWLQSRHSNICSLATTVAWQAAQRSMHG